MEKYAVIMAGGVGSRFWPRSRKASPKQLLNIVGDHSMIQATVQRLEGYIDKDKILIVTNKIQKAIIEEQLPELPADNIIAEPVGRNTAPCIGLSALLIKQMNEDAVFITLPADHLITEKEKFLATLDMAVHFAHREKGLVTFGIQPTRPDTGYGYINFDKNAEKEKIYPVIRFVEKPDYETAQEYLKSGDYLWNSGIFVWRADTVLEEIQKFIPDLFNGLLKLGNLSGKAFQDAMKEVYPALPNISVDYGIMEKSEKVHLVKGEFDWSDVGSWETVYQLGNKDAHKNVMNGDGFLKDTSGSYIFSPNRYAAVLGMENIIVIDTEDALLVCDRSKVQDVRAVVDHLKEKGREDLT